MKRAQSDAPSSLPPSPLPSPAGTPLSIPPSPNCQCEMSPELNTEAVESESDVEVDESVEIQRFVNRSWSFMDACRKGLTGKAAAWAVKKQKVHRTVSRSAYMHLEAVLN
jgi:hypothetical protein